MSSSFLRCGIPSSSSRNSRRLQGAAPLPLRADAAAQSLNPSRHGPRRVSGSPWRVFGSVAGPRLPLASASTKSIWLHEGRAGNLTRMRSAEPVAPRPALAVHRVMHGVEMEVVVAELGNVHQAVDVETVQRDEQTKCVTPLIVPSMFRRRDPACSST